METTVNGSTPAAPAPKAPTCGGCYKTVDPATSVKRELHTTTARYGRYTRALREPVVLHFCDAACRTRADNADVGGRSFRF